MRGGFRGRGRGRGGGPGDMRAMQALREPPKAPGVLYPPFNDPAFLAPPTEFEDLVLAYSMELEDTLRDGIGLPYAPPAPVRTASERAAEASSSSSRNGGGKSKSKSKSKSRDKERERGKKGTGGGDMDVDMEDMDGLLSGGSSEAAAALGVYSQRGIGADQEAFHGWRIPDARRMVGVEIDDLNDRPSKWGQSTSLRNAAASDKLDKDLLFLDPAFFPPGLWDAHFEDDEKGKGRSGKRKRDDVRDDNDLDLPDLDDEDRDSNASSREDEDQFADEEEMDHEDYDANYFDNGEGDDDEGGDDGGGGGDNDF